MRSTFSGLLGAVLVAGCTVSNPSYVDDDAGGPDGAIIVDGSVPADGQPGKVDGAKGPDGAPPPDTRRPDDVEAWPDSVAWKCTKDSDCDDSLSCTRDTCNGQNECEHEVKALTCLIGGACYNQNDTNPTNVCERCASHSDKTGWTALADGASCTDDSLSCTVDHCKGGTCVHEVSSNACLVSGVCRDEGWSDSSDPCNECVTAKSQTSLTFVAGKPCKPAAGIGGMCVNNACSGWSEQTFEPKVPSPGTGLSASINGVAFIPPAKEVWAVGEYGTNVNGGGFLVRLDPGSTPLSTILSTKKLRGIHYRLAVGDDGAAWYHDGASWGGHAGLQAELGGADRVSVWGTPTVAGDVVYMSGTEGLGGPAVLKCILTSPLACEKHTADPLTNIGAVFGVDGALGGTPQVWALAFGVDDDIFYTDGSTAFTTAGPLGCLDLGTGGSTPCSSTNGDYRDLYASKATDVWAVGSSGLIMQYDGTSWHHVTNVIKSQSTMVLDAVYSSPSEGLVTIAAHSSGTSANRLVVLYNFNTELKRWLGPITLVTSGYLSSDLIRDIGGESYGNLWMVGQRAVSSGSNVRTVGWVLKLK